MSIKPCRSAARLDLDQRVRATSLNPLAGKSRFIGPGTRHGPYGRDPKTAEYIRETKRQRHRHRTTDRVSPEVVLPEPGVGYRVVIADDYSNFSK